MSTNILTAADWRSDSPWRRLYWTLPVALSIFLMTLWAFVFFTRSPTVRLPEPAPIEAQLIEIPAPAPHPAQSQEKTPRTPPPVKHVVLPKPKPTPVKHVPLPKPKPKPVLPKKIVPIKPLPKLVKPIEKKVTKPIEERTPPPTPTVAKPNAPQPSPQKQVSTNMISTTGARAIMRPMPQIPDDLREDALSASALARFHIAVDGTVTVELINPTPNPRLNQLLLDTLKNWRFFPAIKNGKPVASVEDIVIKVEVK